MFVRNKKQLGKTSESQKMVMSKLIEMKSNRLNMTTYLDLTMNESLFWIQEHIIMKGSWKAGLDSIRKLKGMLPQSQLFIVYQALVKSERRYGNLVLGHLPEMEPCTLEKDRTGRFFTESAP